MRCNIFFGLRTSNINSFLLVLSKPKPVNKLLNVPYQETEQEERTDKQEQLRSLCSQFHDFAPDEWSEYLTRIADILGNDQEQQMFDVK